MFGFISKYLTYGLAALLVAALVFAGIQTIRLSREQTAFAEHLRADFDAQVAAEKKARETEHKSTDLAADAGSSFEQEKKNAQTTQSTLFADLAAQRKRLRPVWICPAAGVSPASPAPSELGPAERDREESAARIVGAAAACDAQVDALRHLYNDQRTLINGKR